VATPGQCKDQIFAFICGENLKLTILNQEKIYVYTRFWFRPQKMNPKCRQTLKQVTLNQKSTAHIEVLNTNTCLSHTDLYGMTHHTLLGDSLLFHCRQDDATISQLALPTGAHISLFLRKWLKTNTVSIFNIRQTVKYACCIVKYCHIYILLVCFINIQPVTMLSAYETYISMTDNLSKIKTFKRNV